MVESLAKVEALAASLRPDTFLCLLNTEAHVRYSIFDSWDGLQLPGCTVSGRCENGEQ